MEAEVRDLFEKRRDTQESLQQEYDRYWNILIELSVAEHSLLAKADVSRQFIEERVLWIPSTVPLTKAELPKRLTPRPDTWRSIGSSLLHDAANRPIVYCVGAVMLLLWVLLARSAQRRCRRIDERVAHPYTDSFSLTLKALAVDVFVSLPVPAILWFFGSRLLAAVPLRDAELYDFAQALAQGLSNPAMELFALLLVRRLCRQHGIAASHFQWDADAVRMLHRTLSLVIVFGIPVSFVANFAIHHPDDAWISSVGGVSVLIGMLVLGFLLHQILHPRRGVLAKQTHASREGKPRTLALAFYLAAMTVILAMVIASVVGYQHTVVELERRLVLTIWLAFILVALRAAAMRFVLLTEQKLAIRRARQEQAPGERTEAGLTQTAEDARDGHDIPLSYERVDDKTRVLLRWLVAFGLIVGVWGIWQDVVPAFRFLHRIELWTHTVQVAADADALAREDGAPSQARTQVVPVVLADLMLAIIIAVVAVVLAKNGPNVLEMLLLLRLPIDAGARFAILALLRYAVFIVGFILAFNTIGIGWGQVQWLAAAMTVGLAFGLQEIFANFVSGLIILFERPIRIGDVVSVGDVDGKITRISMRATTVTDWNRRELIVPNKTFVTSQIINWTLSDPVTRVEVPVGIAYGSDTKLARDLLLKAAHECGLVLDEPAPQAIFKGFGDSSLDFELRVFISSRDIWPQMIDELHTSIDDRFRQAGIVIAFPQRDVHVHSVQDLLPTSQGGQQQTSNATVESIPDPQSASRQAHGEQPDA
jgi:potassium efflux system protein